MTVERGQVTESMSRRRLLALGAAVAGVAGASAMIGGSAGALSGGSLALGGVVDDPLAGMIAGAQLAGAPRADAPRRGRRGFRPRRALPEGTVFGTIEIPALGLSETLREGIELRFLDFGPGHWPGTAFPGQPGNCVIAGHRVSHSRPFLFIDTVPTGAMMTLTMAGAAHDYVATSAGIVDPADNSILNWTAERSATIFACHPPGSVTQRYIVNFVSV